MEQQARNALLTSGLTDRDELDLTVVQSTVQNFGWMSIDLTNSLGVGRVELLTLRAALLVIFPVDRCHNERS